MPIFQMDAENTLYYEHTISGQPDGATFVFFNALTGDTATWEQIICPILRDAGHGTLTYDMRGQGKGRFSPETELDADLMIRDAEKLLANLRPVRPVFVGLSIGGLFASRAWLNGVEAVGLVLINTLREDGHRLRWIGDALVRAVETGGLELFRDLFLPLLMNEEWLGKSRAGFLKEDTCYESLKRESGAYKLIGQAGRSADWNLPYERINLPTLLITGLQDHVFLERPVVDRLAKRLPRGKRINLPDCGHLVPAERPELLARILLDFAKEV